VYLNSALSATTPLDENSVKIGKEEMYIAFQIHLQSTMLRFVSFYVAGFLLHLYASKRKRTIINIKIPFRSFFFISLLIKVYFSKKCD
jgi:hypothetical protein